MPKIIPQIKHKKYLIAAVVGFAALEMLFVYFMYNVAFSLFSYICVISSCLFCAMLADGSRSWLFTQLGLLGTLGADFFLVFLPVQRRAAGMIFFCGVQILYFMRIYLEDENKTRRRLNLILRTVASVSLLIITPIVLGSRMDAVSILSMFYYANLTCNVLFAFLNFRSSCVFAFALLAFILSDTLLGFQYLGDYFLIPRGSFVYYAIYYGKRVCYPFYILSQMLIPISMASRKLKKIQS